MTKERESRDERRPPIVAFESLSLSLVHPLLSQNSASRPLASILRKDSLHGGMNFRINSTASDVAPVSSTSPRASPRASPRSPTDSSPILGLAVFSFTRTLPRRPRGSPPLAYVASGPLPRFVETRGSPLRAAPQRGTQREGHAPAVNTTAAVVQSVVEILLSRGVPRSLGVGDARVCADATASPRRRSHRDSACRRFRLRGSRSLARIGARRQLGSRGLYRARHRRYSPRRSTRATGVSFEIPEFPGVSTGRNSAGGPGERSQGRVPDVIPSRFRLSESRESPRGEFDASRQYLSQRGTDNTCPADCTREKYSR